MVVTEKLSLSTDGDCHVIDVTGHVAQHVAECGMADGIVTVFAAGTTVGVGIIEYEPGLLKDLEEAMERLVPREIPYQHNILNNDDNGHAHTQATLMGQSLVVPFTDKQPTLGTWQRIVVVDFDSRPRTREVVIQMMGE